MQSKLIEFLDSQITSIFDAIFSYEKEKRKPAISRLFLIVIFIVGIFLWGKFFDWVRTPLNFSDWSEINIPRIQFIQDSLRQGLLPLHMADKTSLHDISDRFFTLPDVITTPQMILLLFVSLKQFILIDVFINYTIGFFSLLWFRKKFNISILIFSAFFFLFNFNGYILSHYSVGHFTWGAYFLFPAFFALMINFYEGKQGWIWVGKVAFLLFFMVLQGSEHHYVWLLIFMGVFLFMNLSRAKWIVAAALSSGLLSAIRLLPPVLQLADYHKKAIYNAVYGYPSLSHVLLSLSLIQLPAKSSAKYFSLYVFTENYWEFNIYIGLIGTFFLIIFGLIVWVKAPKPLYHSFILPICFLIALSIDSTYWLFRLTNIPLFASERASMRIIGVPLVWFILIAAINFQIYWDKKERFFHEKMLTLIGLGFVLIDLWSNLKIWRPDQISAYFSPSAINSLGNSVGNHNDPSYIFVLWIGLGLTLLTSIFIIFMMINEKRSEQISSSNLI